MAKPTSGQVEPAPERDTDQMAVDTLMTSVFSGISLIVATVVLAITGVVFLDLSRSLTDSSVGAMVGFAIGLLMGALLIGWLLTRYADRIKGRSRNLYRGAWIGSGAALIIIVLLYFAPQVAFPQYCPPGQICSNGQR
jgi:purine-cytosine permease-like protein